ncbi:alpha/beta-hydrolase [Lophium mytilinum]|uniref:Alpha/beta-hydrolase n=1 Tax=Lophium mytilinum TaxID=390894 RepID=A0A6A6QVH8_9PEZI|nr:alpha/beta-hydrolase [Lophium mytilinum]
MPSTSNNFVLPRPGFAPSPPVPPIPAPSESAFTTTFGALLPPAQYLHLHQGNAAYYPLPPSTPSPNPPRILLIHGVQTPALGLLPLVRALRASFPTAHLALLDLWGHGLSDTPVLPHTPALFHSLLDAVFDALAWPTAHLIGYSFGGALAVGYAVSRPSRVQSFTLVAPAGLIRSAALTDEERGHLRGGGDEAAARRWVLEFLGGYEAPPGDWRERVARGEVVAEAVRAWQMREHGGHGASVVAVVRDAGPFDSDAEFLKAVQTGIPSLVVLGELDEVCAERDIKELGFGNVVVVPQVGHGVVRERVPEVAGFISDFWTKINLTSSG